MFVKCPHCGYLTPEAGATCKQCRAQLGPVAPEVPTADVDAATAARTLADIDAAKAVLLTHPDLGSRWTAKEILPVAYDVLDPRGGCFDPPGLPDRARFGRDVQFVRDLTPEGTVSGTVYMAVFAYRNAHDAKVVYEARANPRYLPCIQEEDLVSLVDASGADLMPLGIEHEPSPDVRASVSRDVIAYTFSANRRSSTPGGPTW